MSLVLINLFHLVEVYLIEVIRVPIYFEKYNSYGTFNNSYDNYMFIKRRGGNL